MIPRPPPGECRARLVEAYVAMAVALTATAVAVTVGLTIIFWAMAIAAVFWVLL